MQFRESIAVLGIDAAWTANRPSGVALIRKDRDAWRFVAAEASYQAFLLKAELSESCANSIDPASLLKASERLLSGERVAVVAVDMPMARTPITGRRTSDNALSRRFGAQGCSTHSPSAMRPGPVGTAMSEGWTRLGYKLATFAVPRPDKALIEVYPHPALLSLLRADRRIQYKVSKSGKYWPGTTVRFRIERLLQEMQKILFGLRSEIIAIDLVLPSPGEISTLTALKPCEDTIDALVCCWVGTKYLAGQVEPFGDDDSSIWCPKQVATGDSKQPRARSC